MKCEAFRDLLPLHAGGDLEPHELKSVDAHLATCVFCRLKLDEFRATKSLFNRLAMTGFMPPVAGIFSGVPKPPARKTRKKPEK